MTSNTYVEESEKAHVERILGEVKMSHPHAYGVFKFMDYRHLKGQLRSVSRTCFSIASDMFVYFPQDSPELTAGLRKILEAKDCFVRAALDK